MELPTKLFPSVNIADGNNSVSKSVGINRRKNTVGDAAGIYRRHRRRREIFFENCNSGMTWIIFRRIYRRKYRGIQTRTAKQGRVANTGGITDGIFPSVIPSEKPVYTGSADTLSSSLPLFLLLLPHPTSPLPNCSQPPISTLPSSQHKLALKFLILLYMVTTSVNSCGFYHFL